MSTILMSAFNVTYQSKITAGTDIDCFIIQLSTLVTVEKYWDTNWRMGHVVCNNDNYHEHRIQPCQQEKSNTSDIFKIEYNPYGSMECTHRSKNLQSMAQCDPWISMTDNQRRSKDTIASQYSCDYVSCYWGKCVEFDCGVHLQLLQPHKIPEDSENSKGNWDSPRMTAIRNPTSNHSSWNLRNTLLGIDHQSSVITILQAAVPTSHQCHGFQQKSTKGERHTGTTLVAAAETTKPSLYVIYMATCSKPKHQSTAAQWASLLRGVYSVNSSYNTNQYSPLPWTGNDVSEGEPKYKSIGSELWIP